MVMSRTMLSFCLVAALSLGAVAFSPYHGSSSKMFGLSKHRTKAMKFLSPLQMVTYPEKPTEIEKRPGKNCITFDSFPGPIIPFSSSQHWVFCCSCHPIRLSVASDHGGRILYTPLHRPHQRSNFADWADAIDLTGSRGRPLVEHRCDLRQRGCVKFRHR